MAKLPWAKMSPRIENGVIFWYEGDTFKLHLHLDLQDTDGEKVIPEENDTLELTFYDKSCDPVTSLRFEGNAVAQGVLTVSMDEAISALFPAGKYTYDLCLQGQERTTLIRGGEAVVE